MEEKNELKVTKESKQVKDIKAITEVELITAYAQLIFHTLKHSQTEITPQTIRAEIKMFYEKFGNKEVKRLASIVLKDKKGKK